MLSTKNPIINNHTLHRESNRIESTNFVCIIPLIRSKMFKLPDKNVKGK